MPRFDVTTAGELNLDAILYGLPEELPPEQELLTDRTMLTLGSLLMVGLGILMATSGEPGNIAVGPWFIYIGSAITVIAWTPRWFRKRFIVGPTGSAERLDRPLELL